jgi:two-component system chemotaxis sensor kinase CheA
LTETAESLDHVDAQLVRFEREPNNGQVLGHIFRLSHHQRNVRLSWAAAP